uniref:Uncharacterized protein n=1 Tax=Avena sativa TaxID=4498 RepID=A0ACD5UGE8_AVESA
MSSSSSRAPAPSRGGASAPGGCTDPNTTFVQADPATFRALVQRLTGAPGAAAAAQVERQHAAGAVFAAVPLPMRRPKLQERRRATPGRLDLSLARPQPFYYHHQHHHHHHHHGLMQYSPVSTMDYAHVMAVSSSPASSPSPSPPSSCSCGVVISKEEEEREEKAIASKAFYLHSSPRSAGGDGAERPKLLPLFPVHHSPRSSSFA